MSFNENWLKAGSFSWKAAYALASACKLAYEPTKFVQNELDKSWGPNTRVFSIGETQGFVAHGNDAVVVAFRGTSGTGDWLANLNLAYTDAPEFHGRAHEGFMKAYEDTAEVVSEALSLAAGKKLWFTGHSLGGALALIGGARHFDQKISGVVTFGQPLLLNRKGQRYVNTTIGDTYSRIVNDNDIVARIPPFFYHAGNLFHFNSAGKLLKNVSGASFAPTSIAPTLTEQEFKNLQSELRNSKGAFDAAEAKDKETVGYGADAKGIIPGVPAHRIDSYLALMNNMANS